ncbi:hypothetical protein HDU98_001801 [Podochytrium sp. JEL0797]|nr:hypothetical protein HDU98_001801 [Podochytrium sp. JEL0797]
MNTLVSHNPTVDAYFKSSIGPDAFHLAFSGPERNAPTMWHHLGNCTYKLPYRLTNPGTFTINLRHAYDKFKAVSEIGDEWPQPAFTPLLEEGFELNVCPECPSFSAKMLEAEVNPDLPLCSRTEPQQGVFLNMTMETEREVYKFKNYGFPYIW